MCILSIIATQTGGLLIAKQHIFVDLHELCNLTSQLIHDPLELFAFLCYKQDVTIQMSYLLITIIELLGHFVSVNLLVDVPPNGVDVKLLSDLHYLLLDRLFEIANGILDNHLAFVMDDFQVCEKLGVVWNVLVYVTLRNLFVKQDFNLVL